MLLGIKKKENKQMKKAGWAIFIIACCLIGFLALPSNFYLRRALVHLLPGIDDYPIFENRVIRAENPQSWPLADTYNTKHINKSYLPVFEELETIAYIVIQDSAVVFEQYWNQYTDSSYTNSFSMAKSIVSLAVGCAIDDGYIKSVDQPVSDFVPQFSGYNGKQLTIKHLLTMSAGVDFDEAYSSPFSATTKFYYGNNLEELTLAMKEVTEPGIRFNYQSGVTQLLALLTEKAIGGNISEYISRKLWTPMGAEENALWCLDRKDGLEKAYCCFNSNARDFARFGQLLLNQGSWNGKQLISQTYLKEATTPATWLQSQYNDGPNQEYGYQFWHLQHKEMNIPYMRGILGQYIFVIPEKNAVVVRLGHKRSDTRTAQHYPDDIVTWLDAALEILN